MGRRALPASAAISIDKGIALSGVVLVSSVLNFQTLRVLARQ